MGVVVVVFNLLLSLFLGVLLGLSAPPPKSAASTSSATAAIGTTTATAISPPLLKPPLESLSGVMGDGVELDVVAVSVLVV